MSFVSAGALLLPACNLGEAIPVYERVPLEDDQYRLIDWLTQAILPDGEPLVETPEKATHFVLTMLNDCYAPEDIEKYRLGLQLFNQHIEDTYNTSYKRLDPEQQVLLFTEVSESEILPDNLKYFLSTTKRLTVRHFTTSEYFLTNHLDFEFVPGRFVGCVPV